MIDRKANKIETGHAAAALAREKLKARIIASISAKAKLRKTGGTGKEPAIAPLPAVLVDAQGIATTPATYVDTLRRHYTKECVTGVEPTPEDITAYVRATFNHLVSSASKFVDPVAQSISLDEMVEAIMVQKSGKAAGGDGVPVDLLKWLPLPAIDRLREIFNACIVQGVVPEAWLEGIIVPLLKAGRDASLLASYRPITLLSSLWKTLERILHRRLMRPIERQMVDEQGWGFPGRGADETLFTLTEAVHQSASPVFACFLDIREAFDSVWLESMLVRLHEYGVEGPTWKLLQTWYTNYKARVRLPGGMQTPSFPVRIGTRQGSVLSPIFFAIFINDLGRRLARTGKGVRIRGADSPLSCLLYGDDVVLLAESPEDLQHMLNIASAFATAHQLRFAVAADPASKDSKCKAMALGPLHHRTPSAQLRLFRSAGDPMSGFPVSWVNAHTYLGVPLRSGAGLLDGAIRERCAAAESMCTQWVAGDSSRIRKASAEEKTTFFLTEVASRRDYGLIGLRLSQAQLERLQQSERACEVMLGISLRKGHRLHCRVANKKAKMAAKFAKAAWWSWRHRLWRSMLAEKQL